MKAAPKKSRAATVPDRRVRRTHRQLRDALINLILERGWDAVSVRDVCERADVGRSTFYVHFADKENLLLSGFDELHESLQEAQKRVQSQFGFLEPLILHAEENRRLARALLGRQSGQQVHWRFRDVLGSLVESELEALRAPPASRPGVARFISGGMLERMMTWLEHPQGVSAESLAAELRWLALGVLAAAKPR